MKNGRSSGIWLLAVLCAVTTCMRPPESMGQGKLDAFEADASAHSTGDSKHHHGCSDLLSASCGEGFSDLFKFTVVQGGVTSWQRLSDGGAASVDIAPRAIGEPLIPFARIDLAYQNVESDVDALNIRGELGYGPFGAGVDFTRYREDSPSDDLDLVRVLGLYRMSFGSYVETDLGLGVLTLSGNDTTSKFLFSFPVLVYPIEYVGVEFRPAWADRVSDYDLALVLSYRCASVKLGYRWLASPNESLDGPYAGISIRL